LRFTSLSSGSEGNALIVEAAAQAVAGSASRNSGRLDCSRVLVDCGLPLKEMVRRLAERGLHPTDVDAIFVTHEHSDHIGGVARFARAAEIPVYLSHGSRMSCSDEFWKGVQCIEVESHAAFTVGTLRLQAFPVPHDAREPTQLVVADGHHRLGILTDTGKGTPHIAQMLSGCDGLFLEANHDTALLQDSDYPAGLKARIAGPFGHLSNDDSAEILRGLDQSRLQTVIAAHLSRQNNTAELVTAALTPALSRGIDFRVATQMQGFDWVTLA
jgi:phosphoribosyl 1,2-cyclic phosphodiesterase